MARDVQPMPPMDVTQGCAKAYYTDPASGMRHHCARVCRSLVDTSIRCRVTCPGYYTCVYNSSLIHSNESLSKTTVTSVSTISTSFYPDTVAYDIPFQSILVGITALCICLIVLVFCCCLCLKCKEIHFYWDKLVRLCFGKSHQDSLSQKVPLTSGQDMEMKRSRTSSREQEDELGSPCTQARDIGGPLEQVSLLQANMPSTSIDAENVIIGSEPHTSLRDKLPKGPVRVVSNDINMDIETGGNGLHSSCDSYPSVNSIMTNSSTFFSPMEHSGTRSVADINPVSDGQENHVEIDSAAVERNSIPDCMAKQISRACGVQMDNFPMEVNNGKKYVANKISCQTAQPDSSDQKPVLSQATNELPDAGDRATAKESITYPSDAMSCADSWKGSVERELHMCQHQAGTPLQSELLDDSLNQSASPDIGYTNHVSLPLRVSTKSPPLDTRGVSRDFEFCSFESPSATGCLESSNSSLESYLGSLMPEEVMEALCGNASAVITYPSEAASCADSWKGSAGTEPQMVHRARTPVQSELLDDFPNQSASPDFAYTNHLSLPLRVSTKSPPPDTRGVSRDFELCSSEALRATGCLDPRNSSLESLQGSCMSEEALGGNACALIDEQTIPKQIDKERHESGFDFSASCQFSLDPDSRRTAKQETCGLNSPNIFRRAAPDPESSGLTDYDLRSDSMQQADSACGSFLEQQSRCLSDSQRNRFLQAERRLRENKRSIRGVRFREIRLHPAYVELFIDIERGGIHVTEVANRVRAIAGLSSAELTVTVGEPPDK